ncbi:MAG: hypothetical protein QGH82_00500, partial [Candidatus Woesearchaeota archaeon]|nr:hypothetical protein [Candidatus Woesearchaeota archaeon]
EEESETNPEPEEEGADECPQELEDAYVEAEAFLTRAKKQRAEIEKARGFFRKGVSPGDQDKATSSIKSRLPCSKCKGFGHWHKDPQCPMKDKPFPGKAAGKGKKQKKRKKKKKHHSHATYVVTLNGMNLSYVAYADTACARSVTGQENADELLSRCRARSWPCLIVDDHEPFRFGPGKRIWSEKALIVAVVWGDIVVVIRFSIVPPQVPFLVSKYVFKRLAVRLDLDDNELQFKRFNNQSEPLYDLPSGHVAIELVKANIQPPEVDPATMELCQAGEEVTVNDPEMRKRLANIPQWDNKTHVVQLPNYGSRTISFDVPQEEGETDFGNDENMSETEKEDVANTEVSEYLTDLCAGKHKLNARTRAAPFYNELAPGWRARALDLAPPYRRYAPSNDPPMELSESVDEVDDHAVEPN